MAEPLRVLIVEDSEDDARLLVRELEHAGYDVAWERVETAEAMRSALRTRAWDFVISDYSLPSFNAPAALATLQTFGLDLPFIIVSGTVGEDVAVEGMRAGAQDFILKQNLARLAPAIGRELDQASQRRAMGRAEKALRASEKRFRSYFELGVVGMAITSPAKGMIEVNDEICKILGYERGELLNKTWAEMTHPDDLPADVANFDRVLAGEIDGYSMDKRWIRKDGRIVDSVISVKCVRREDGSVENFVALLHDVTESRQAEKEIRKSEERFRKLFDANTIGIVIADVHGKTLEANDAYLSMIGYTREELLSGVISWNDITPAEFRAGDQVAVEQLQRTGVSQPWEKELIRKDGTRVPILIGVAMLGESGGTCIAYIVDLSSRKLLEDQLRLSQKMEAVGQLAGGIAHDFNNLLTAILGYTDLLGSKLPPDSPLQEEIGEVRRAGQRAAALTRQLLAFSRKQVLEPVVLDVNELVRNLEKLLRRLIEEDVKLDTRLDPSVARVRVDPGQLEQVIVNLVVNARDAMPDGGKLTIETGNVSIDEAYAQRHVTVTPGRYVMVAVSDTGTGMDAETQAHIFEPFFTTKEKGKGTGLGLSTVYGIVKQSGGNIWVYSEPGKGTTFKVYLPRVEATPVEGMPLSAVSHTALGTETILVVEDEPAIRSLSRRVLEERGYRVLEAGSGKDALERVREEKGPIHLLLTDLVMPDMPGTELASRLEQVRPGVRVLFMSGYTDDGVVRSGLLGSGHAFLQKPFTPGILARKVRDILS